MIKQLKAKINRFVNSEEGASAIEYGLIAGLIAALLIVAVTGIGTQLQTFFQGILTALTPSGG